MSKIKVEKIRQIGIVVGDVNQKIENYKNLLIVDESKIMILNTTNASLGFKNRRYLGKAVNFDLIIGLFDLGGIQIELIQPLNKSGDPYSDFLNEKGEGIHHVLIGLEDKNAKDFLTVMKELDLLELTGGTIAGSDYFYYDLTDKLGLVFEVGISGPGGSKLNNN
jgi:hypothetical protein